MRSTLILLAGALALFTAAPAAACIAPPSFWTYEGDGAVVLPKGGVLALPFVAVNAGASTIAVFDASGDEVQGSFRTYDLATAEGLEVEIAIDELKRRYLVVWTPASALTEGTNLSVLWDGGECESCSGPLEVEVGPADATAFLPNVASWSGGTLSETNLQCNLFEDEPGRCAECEYGQPFEYPAIVGAFELQRSTQWIRRIRHASPDGEALGDPAWLWDAGEVTGSKLRQRSSAPGCYVAEAMNIATGEILVGDLQCLDRDAQPVSPESVAASNEPAEPDPEDDAAPSPAHEEVDSAPLQEPSAGCSAARGGLMWFPLILFGLFRGGFSGSRRRPTSPH